jgi:hypothetical protein
MLSKHEQSKREENSLMLVPSIRSGAVSPHNADAIDQPHAGAFGAQRPGRDDTDTLDQQ